MSDPFDNNREGLESPADNALDIDAEKSDSVDLSITVRGVHVNVGGTIRGILAGDSAEHDFVVNTGALYPYRFKRVFATGTDATGLVGLY